MGPGGGGSDGEDELSVLVGRKGGGGECETSQCHVSEKEGRGLLMAKLMASSCQEKTKACLGGRKEGRKMEEAGGR